MTEIELLPFSIVNKPDAVAPLNVATPLNVAIDAKCRITDAKCRNQR